MPRVRCNIAASSPASLPYLPPPRQPFTGLPALPPASISCTAACTLLPACCLRAARRCLRAAARTRIARCAPRHYLDRLPAAARRCTAFYPPPHLPPQHTHFLYRCTTHAHARLLYARTRHHFTLPRAAHHHAARCHCAHARIRCLLPTRCLPLLTLLSYAPVHMCCCAPPLPFCWRIPHYHIPTMVLRLFLILPASPFFTAITAARWFATRTGAPA